MELLKEVEIIQNKYGYLPYDQLFILSEENNIPLAEIYGIVSFYKFFYFDAPLQESVSKHIEKIYPLKKEGRLLQYGDTNKWSALKKAKESPDEVIQILMDSRLMGRSGSGFPVGIKWKLTAETISETKYVVCNADEGEPGTGKDRVILERNPYSVIEGIAICAAAVGAKSGFIYLREEYSDLKEYLENVIASAPLNNFKLEVRMGHGAYICGEETALINSIEGKRGETRLKPPFPGVSGLYGKPTVVNNVESFLCVPMIVLDGAELFKSMGEKDYAGSKLFTIFGAVKNPGVYELTPGMRLGDCIAQAGGVTGEMQAVLTGGGSGTLLTPEYLDVPMTLKACEERGVSFGVASIRVISSDENLVSEVRQLVEFFVKESCGTCSPCRIGLQRVYELLRKIEEGRAHSEDIEQLNDLIDYIPNNARCGLGLAAVTPVRTLINHFPEVLR